MLRWWFLYGIREAYIRFIHMTAYNSSRSLGIKYYHKPLLRIQSQPQESDSWRGRVDQMCVCVCRCMHMRVSYNRNIWTEITVQLSKIPSWWVFPGYVWLKSVMLVVLLSHLNFTLANSDGTSKRLRDCQTQPFSSCCTTPSI